ncbi:MAG: MFS transporter, partial [Solirubrobacterales bacterium]
ALSVLGLQQSSVWGWGSWMTIGSIVVGSLLLVAFVLRELKVEDPLLRIRIFTDRAFSSQNVVLFILSFGFIPLFFFTSTYAQLSLGESPSNAGLYILTFFIGFAIAAQVGGRILDKVGARPAVVAGGAIAAVGFYLWGRSLTDLSWSAQTPWIIMSGFGMGMVLAPSNTDAINRAPATSYGEATGITQTVRNYGASLGMAVLGTILITQNRLNLEDKLGGIGVPKAVADRIASQVVGGGGPEGGPSGANGEKVFEAIQNAYAASTSTVFYVIAGAMAVMFLFSLVFVPKGRAPEKVADDAFESPAEAEAESEAA